MLMSGVVFAHSIDTGPLTFDLGVPISYYNVIDVLGTFANFNKLTSVASVSALNTIRNLPLTILSALRTGVEFDFLLNVVPDVLGIGLNTAVLASYGFHPNVAANRMNFLIDVPFRASVRIGIGQTGYIQMHTGVYLQNIVEAASNSSFSVFRYVDVGLRFKIGSFAFGGGYLVEVVPQPSNNNLVPNPKFPFYAGVYIPVI